MAECTELIQVRSVPSLKQNLGSCRYYSTFPDPSYVLLYVSWSEITTSEQSLKLPPTVYQKGIAFPI